MGAAVHKFEVLQEAPPLRDDVRAAAGEFRIAIFGLERAVCGTLDGLPRQ
jgi:hypothetical protein